MKKLYSMSVDQMKMLLNDLPHAFDDLYWNLADTTYKEEVFISLIRVLNIPKEEALKLQNEIFPKNELLKKIFNEEVIECMGCYGEDAIGTTFYGSRTTKK